MLLLVSAQLEWRGARGSSAQPTEHVPLPFPRPRSRLCSDDPSARTCSRGTSLYRRSNQGLSSVYLEHALNCWKPNKDHLAGQAGLPSPSSGVATHRNDVKWGSSYPEQKNITFLCFHESRIPYHNVPYASLLHFSWNRAEWDSLCVL